jgi:hypothetical protein
MQTHELGVGEELQIGEARVTVLDVEDDRVLLRIRDAGCTRLVTLRVPQEGEVGLARRQTSFV